MEIISAILTIAASLLILLGLIIMAQFIFTVIIATILAIFEMDLVKPVTLAIITVIIIVIIVKVFTKV